MVLRAVWFVDLRIGSPLFVDDPALVVSSDRWPPTRLAVHSRMWSGHGEDQYPRIWVQGSHPLMWEERLEADIQWIPWKSADQLYLLLFQWIVWFQCCVVEPQSSGRKWRHLRADMKIWLIKNWTFGVLSQCRCWCKGNVSSLVLCLCPMTAAIVSRQQWNIDKTAEYWRKIFLNSQLTIFICWLNTRKSGIHACRNLSMLSV